MVISKGELSAFVHGSCHYPHDFLGAHDIGESKVVIRTFLQDAVQCEVVALSSGKAFPMEKLHESGFFEVVIESDHIFDYLFRVVREDGAAEEIRDSYAFLPTVSEYDCYLFNQGRHEQVFEKLGAHVVVHENILGTSFCVWAPSAKRVSVVGEFNRWDGRYGLMRPLGNSGLWELFIPKDLSGEKYKYEIIGADGELRLKSDPCGQYFEAPPHNASIVVKSDFSWEDQAYFWAKKNYKSEAISIYEVHLDSWRRVVEKENRPMTYRELAVALCEYVKNMGFSHIELLPITEYPFLGSWGYQVTGFYAPTNRYGTPDDFRYFVNYCHQQDIGVIIDWVPAHFPKDAFALENFDGTHLYEHADPKQREHKEWGTYIFNYGRHEVRNFLIGSALFWLESMHVDGIRIDAVASMLYLDYAKKPGEWIPNRYGGHENIEAIEFLRALNDTIHRKFPYAITIAEESTSFAGVTQPTEQYGLGFDMKWNMGWMHDVLRYFSQPTLYRKYHHNELTFGMLYQYSERFLLALSHDEVVHGKSSLINKMPGADMKIKAQHLRALYGLMWGWPGKKLLFMGNEFGQSHEWDYRQSLDWHLLQYPDHQGIQHWVRDLNQLYQNDAVLKNSDFDTQGFSWVVVDDCDKSVVGFFRFFQSEVILVMGNFTPVPREYYRVGVPYLGFWQELLNSDATVYGGSGLGNLGGVTAEEIPAHGHPYSLSLTLPGNSALFFKHTGT